jgi:hypothetical protein
MPRLRSNAHSEDLSRIEHGSLLCSALLRERALFHSPPSQSGVRVRMNRRIASSGLVCKDNLRASIRGLYVVANRKRVGGLDHPHILQLAVPKQNSRRRRIVQLDAKANKRRGQRDIFAFGDFVIVRAIAALGNLRNLGRPPSHRRSAAAQLSTLLVVHP